MHDRTADDLSRALDHSFVRAKFKRERDRCIRADRRIRIVKHWAARTTERTGRTIGSSRPYETARTKSRRQGGSDACHL